MAENCHNKDMKRSSAECNGANKSSDADSYRAPRVEMNLIEETVFDQNDKQ